MRAQEIQPGLYRWTAAHPEWNARATPGGPDDWPEVVGSVLYELPDIVVLIDPLIPAGDREEFLAWLDGLVASRPVTILTTIRWHRRDREQLAERYEKNTTRAWNVIPSGIEPLRRRQFDNDRVFNLNPKKVWHGPEFSRVSFAFEFQRRRVRTAVAPIGRGVRTRVGDAMCRASTGSRPGGGVASPTG